MIGCLVIFIQYAFSYLVQIDSSHIASSLKTVTFVLYAEYTTGGYCIYPGFDRKLGIVGTDVFIEVDQDFIVVIPYIILISCIFNTYMVNQVSVGINIFIE